jgi:hypothetical protein
MGQGATYGTLPLFLYGALTPMPNNAAPIAISAEVPNFTWREVSSRTTGQLIVSPLFWDTIHQAQKLRWWWGAPFVVNCGHRTQADNERVAGAPRSMHLRFALDLRPTLRNPIVSDLPQRQQLPAAIEALAAEADRIGFGGIGLYNTFIHLDCRPRPARWDNRT